MCKDSVTAYFVTSGEFTPPPPCLRTPCNTDINVHYSFDYGQQVHYSSDSLHPELIYFLTSWKCTMFVMNCEALPWQVIF